MRNNIFALNLDGQIGTSDKRAGGTFVLEHNVIIGEEPVFYRKYGKEKMEVRKNLIQADASLFADAAHGDFALTDREKALESGFVPWEIDAGRSGG